MQNSLIMPGIIHNETEYNNASARLKVIYREIMKLVIKKEEYEEQIDEYLKKKIWWRSEINFYQPVL